MSILTESLQNPDPQTRKQAIEEAAQSVVTSELLALVERLAASDPDTEVRAAALEALDTPKLRALRAQRLMKLTGSEQRFILQELDAWQKQGLIGDELARILRSRYRVVFKPAPVPTAQTAAPAPTTPATAPKADSVPAPVAPSTPREPRPSLAQLLLSEASIKTFLYLGAFFVIAAAVILAALVEVLRLPILSVAVLAFGGTAVALKKRLPQPSFVLFIVFSFLLPINAGVFSDLVNLAGQALAAYWTFVLLVCAAIWIFATWFYNSRFFSLTALGAFVYSAWFLPAIFSGDPSGEARLLALQLANLAGLAGVFMLVRKKDWPFSNPTFLFGQFINILLVFGLAVISLLNLFDYYTNNSANADSLWLAISAAWLLTGLYYVTSNILKPFALFPWFASAALAPVLFLAQHAVEFTRLDWALALGWSLWAAMLTLLSEVTYRIAHLQWLKNRTQPYSLPLALAGIVLFLLGGLWGIFTSVTWGFALFLSAAILLGLAHLIRPRGWVWLAGLLDGLFAYFIFFDLPFMPDLDEYLLYKLTLVAILFILPDVLLRPDWGARLKWFLPLSGLAIILGAWTILGIFLGGMEDQTQSAVSALLLSGAYWVYAIRYQKPKLGYLPGLLLPLGLAYGFGALNEMRQVNLGFTAISVLAILYYLAGWALERLFKLEDWSRTLRWIALALAPALALTAIFAENPLEGWFVALLGLLFVAETRRHPLIETIAPLFLIFGFGLILFENKVQPGYYYLAGMAALWLTMDYAYKRILSTRPMRSLTAAGAVILTTLAAGFILFETGATVALFVVSLALTIFLLAYGLLYQNAQLGYIFTAFLSISALTLARLWLADAWLWSLTPLALAYFGLGLALKNGWGKTLRFSGLGLAGLTALSAPFAPQQGAGWFVAVLALIWLAETWINKRPWAEGGFYLGGLLAFGLVLEQYGLLTAAYFSFGMAVFLLGFDLILGFSIQRNPALALLVRSLGGLSAGVAVLACLPNGISAGELLIAFALTAFFGLYAPLRRQPMLGYIPAGLLALSILFLLAWLDRWDWWPWALILLSVGYYLASLALGRVSAEWSRVLRFSTVGLGTLTSFGALAQGPSVAASIPVAIAASLWAVEAFRRRNVWLGFPTNGLYLMSYFMLLTSLEVTQPQFYSIGAALLGLLMHYLLTRAGSDKGAFVTGLVSQLVLLGTTYIQMLATEELGYFAALFFQALAVLVYGLVLRSRSLVGVPIAMLVLGVTTIVLFILRGLSTVILIGCTGIVMILVATLAVVLRERLAQVGERLSGWRA